MGTAGIATSENPHLTRKSLDDQCHRRLLQVGMTVMRERHSHPYGQVDPESGRSRSVCLGKWKRSRAYFLRSQCRRGKGILTFYPGHRRRHRCLTRLLSEMKPSLQFRLEDVFVLRTLMS